MTLNRSYSSQVNVNELVCSYRISEAANNNIKADLFEDKSIMALTLVYSIVLNIDIQHDIMD